MTPEFNKTDTSELDPEAIEAAEIQALLPTAAHFFGLGSIQNIKPTPFGIGNESFFVSSEQGDFVLRVLWEQTIEGLEKEVAIEQQLAHAGVLSAQLLQGENGNYYFTDGKYTITASRKIEGIHPHEITPDLLNQVGTTMATFHTSVTEIPQETSQWFTLDNARIEVAKVSSDEESKSAIENNVTTGSSIFNRDLPTGFIHGDLYNGNLILTPDNRLAVLDFETTERNVLIIDIARTILDMCADDVTVNTQSVEALLDGYEEIRQLTDEERESLSDAIRYVSGAMAAWLIVEREQKEVAQNILQRAESLRS
ncbi:MAG TPA: phosphotransferase [Patescibacteria group bacterium]